MHVQSTERDGLTPGGAEILTPQSPASAQQVMPAVDVAGVAPTLVLANPHGASTSARVVVSGPDGPVEAATREDVEIPGGAVTDRKSTRLNSSHVAISYAVFCLKKKTLR